MNILQVPPQGFSLRSAEGLFQAALLGRGTTASYLRSMADRAQLPESVPFYLATRIAESEYEDRFYADPELLRIGHAMERARVPERRDALGADYDARKLEILTGILADWHRSDEAGVWAGSPALAKRLYDEGHRLWHGWVEA